MAEMWGVWIYSRLSLVNFALWEMASLRAMVGNAQIIGAIVLAVMGLAFDFFSRMPTTSMREDAGWLWTKATSWTVVVEFVLGLWAIGWLMIGAHLYTAARILFCVGGLILFAKFVGWVFGEREKGRRIVPLILGTVAILSLIIFELYMTNFLEIRAQIASSPLPRADENQKPMPQPAASKQTRATKPPTSSEIAAELAKKLQEEAAKHLQPLVKRGSPFAAQIPFTVYQDRWGWAHAGVPIEASSAAFNDPLSSTYSILELASRTELTQYNPQTHQAVNLTFTNDQKVHLIGRTLQYCILRSIVEMGNPATEMRVENGQTTATPTYMVVIPDEEEYPRKQIIDLLNSFQLPAINSDWIWNEHTKARLKVPRGTTINLPGQNKEDKPQEIYILRFERKPDFTLDFTMKPAIRNKGTPPKNFVLGPDQGSVNDMDTYIFNISMQFTWNADHNLDDPYIDWAVGIYEGLKKSFVTPP